MEHLLTLCRDLVAPHDSEASDAIGRAIGLPRDRGATPCPLPHVLDGALSAATVDATRDVVAALSASRDDLTWFAPPDAVPDVMRTRAVAAELVGPDATYHAADVRIGLMAIGADTHYPAHRHASAEHYLLISGGAFFSSGSSSDRWLGPGEVLVNPPLAWHTTRTTDGPVLVLYTWSGDVSFDSYELQT